MQIVEAKDIIEKLAELLLAVKAGEELLIRDEGKVIARLIPESDAAEEEENGLRKMVAEGLVAPPQVGLPRRSPPSVTLRGKPISETVLEDRR